MVPGNEYISILDVSNPEPVDLLGGINLDGYPHSIAYRHPFAFVAAGADGDGLDRGLVVIDVTDSSNPEIAYHGSSWSFRDLVLAEDLAIAIGLSALLVIDVSDPHAPKLLGECPLPNYARQLDYSDGHVFVATRDDGLMILSIEDPADPQIVATFPTQGAAYDVAVRDGLAYVAQYYQGLEIVDVSDPDSPAILGNLYTGGSHIHVNGSRAYLTGSDLAIVDIADPTSPVLLGTTEVQGWAGEIVVRGNTAFVANHFTGLYLLDVSDPAQTRFVGNINVPEDLGGIALGENAIFLVSDYEGYGGFHIAPMQCTITAVENTPPAPATVLAAYPNPFNPQTTFRFELATAGPVHLEIFDVAGRHVATPIAGRMLTAGVHELDWQARDESGRSLPTGVYLYRMLAGGLAHDGKLTLLK